jgi:hypothetical protein
MNLGERLLALSERTRIMITRRLLLSVASLVRKSYSAWGHSPKYARADISVQRQSQDRAEAWEAIDEGWRAPAPSLIRRGGV